MINPIHRTGCVGFDKNSEALSSGFSRTKTQFSMRIPDDLRDPIDTEGRRIRPSILREAKNRARGGILHEFGNPASNLMGWRTHGWVAVDRNGAAVFCLSALSGVSQKVMASLRLTLFAAPSVPVKTIRFPTVFALERAQADSLQAGRRKAERLATSESRRFHSQTRRKAPTVMATVEAEIEDKLALLDIDDLV